jgi:glycine cleavage system H lipoate-binding protein
VGQIVSAVLAGCRLDFARWYGGDGVWAAFDAESGNLDVGLAGCVWRILQPIEEVVAPRSGVSFEAGETCGWLLKSERAIPIRIPVGGTIVELNEAVVEALEDAGQLDGPENWLFRVRSGVRPTESTRLFRGEDALIWQLRRLRILKGHLRRALELEGSDLGILMADGGELETNLEVILGRERYGEMIDALF